MGEKLDIDFVVEVVVGYNPIIQNSTTKANIFYFL
jgi:hypothetical protein